MFNTGDLTTQRAVRYVRIALVTPFVLLVVSGVTVGYHALTDLAWPAVLAGGLTALMNNLSEVEQGYLRQHLRVPHIVLSDLSARAVGLAAVMLHWSVATAFLIVASIRWSNLAWFSRDDPSRKFFGKLDARSATRKAFAKGPFSLTLLYILQDRMPFMWAGMIPPSSLAGVFGATQSSQQTVASILMTGPQTVLARRATLRRASHNSVDPESERKSLLRFEMLVVLAAVCVSAAFITLRSPLCALLGLNLDENVERTWILVFAALPVSITHRVMHLRLADQSRYRPATWSMSVSLLGSLSIAIIAVTQQDLSMLASSPLFGEGAGLIWLLLLLRTPSGAATTE